MAKYILAIDETGVFSLKGGDKSFVCGTVVEADELKLRQAYQEVYREFGFSEPVPSCVNDLLQTKEDIEDKARFHFNKLTESQSAICKEHLLPFAKKIYVSKNKPTMFANNQNWWFVAVTVVIEKFLQDYPFEKQSQIEILIDSRKSSVWGIVSKDDNDIAFMDYHNMLGQQIKSRVNHLAEPRGHSINIKFKQDTNSLYVNLADLVCGFVRRERDTVNVDIVEASCLDFTEQIDVDRIAIRNPLSALNCIFQEVMNNNFKNVSLANRLISRLRKDSEEYYLLAWDSFYEFLKLKIESRCTHSALVKTKDFVEVFLNELKNTKGQQLKGGELLELITLFTEYYSHIGGTSLPIDEELFWALIRSEDENTETRILRKWEKVLSFTLRQSQIYFNSYDFAKARTAIEERWTQHEELLDALQNLRNGNTNIKDEPTTALIGTLAQTYAYTGDIKQAIEFFELSKEYAIKSASKTDSYIFCLHHRQKDIEACRKDFEAVCQKSPEQYAKDNNHTDLWILLLYCKLRALELYVHKHTELPRINLSQLSTYNSEYPFPLVMKWEAIALWLENPSENRSEVEKYFSDAINNLCMVDNGFAIRTLALPLIQCYGLVNNQNMFHAKYQTMINELTKLSAGFKDYVDSSEILKSIKNDCDIWDRALSLPFIYS